MLEDILFLEEEKKESNKEFLNRDWGTMFSDFHKRRLKDAELDDLVIRIVAEFKRLQKDEPGLHDFHISVGREKSIIYFRYKRLPMQALVANHLLLEESELKKTAKFLVREHVQFCKAKLAGKVPFN